MLETTLDQGSDLSSKLSFDDFRKIIVEDYRVAVESRYVSLLGRKEVLTGKAKFGILEMAKSWHR